MMSENNDNKRKDPFQAPEGYFDSLADRIEARLEEQVIKPEGKVVRMPLRLLYAAAAMITLLAVFWQVIQEEATPTSARLIAELTDEEIIEYLADSDLTVEEILENASFDASEADSLQWQIMPDLDLGPGEIDELIEMYDLEEMENS